MAGSPEWGPQEWWTEAVAELWGLADLATPMAVRVAATLRVADHVAAGMRTAPEIAAVAGVDENVLDRVLRHLLTVGVFSRDEAGRYGLTPLSEAMRDDHLSTMRARLDLESALGRADLSFVHLLHSVRTAQPSYDLQFGRPFWEDLAADAQLGASFQALMKANTGGTTPAIVAAYDWGSVGHIVDVGGGSGSLLVALLTAYPALHGTVVDLPGTAAIAREALAAAGLAGRGKVVAGSFFDPLPSGAGGYLLSAIIHDWADEPARAILRRCAEAAGPGGAVFVIERIGADGESPSTDRDLRMLAYVGGRERSLAELTTLAAEAGLQPAAVHPAEATAIVELVAA